MKAAVQQCSVDKQCFEVHKKELFLENNRLLHQTMSQDVMLCVMNSTAVFGDSMILEMQRTDISKITRKPSKTGKHGHENGRVYKSRKQSHEKVNPQSNSQRKVKPWSTEGKRKLMGKSDYSRALLHNSKVKPVLSKLSLAHLAKARIVYKRESTREAQFFTLNALTQLAQAVTSKNDSLTIRCQKITSLLIHDPVFLGIRGTFKAVNQEKQKEHIVMNRPHGRMILASVEKGPLVWPSITVDGVTRLKEYTELTPAEAIQADCDIKTINIILQGLPTERRVITWQFQVNTKFLNTLPDEWSKFITDVKLVKDLHTTNVDQLHAYLEQHERHANEVRLMHEHLDIPEGQSTQTVITHNRFAYQADDLDAYDSDYDELNTAKVSRQCKKFISYGIRCSFLETEITSDSNIIPYSQYLIESQQVVVQNSNSSAQQDDLILSVIKQLKTQVANCTKTNLENKSVNDTLTAELERYKEQVKVLKEGQNKKQVDTTPIDYAALNQLYKDFPTRFVPQTELSAEQAFWSQNSVNSSEPTLSIRPTNVEVPKELPKVSMSQEKDTVIKKLKERIKSLSGNMDKDKIKQDLEEIETINIELDHREKALAITTLKDELRKLKGKALVDNDVSNHPSDPEMHQVNMEPITPKLLNKRSAHSAYIKHTQGKEAAVLRDLVDHIKAHYPLDSALESAYKYRLTNSGVAYKNQ
ncbi:hypothetical protein Tco_0057996 [Tanacetum coccineum]